MCDVQSCLSWFGRCEVTLCWHTHIQSQMFIVFALLVIHYQLLFSIVLCFPSTQRYMYISQLETWFLLSLIQSTSGCGWVYAYMNPGQPRLQWFFWNHLSSVMSNIIILEAIQEKICSLYYWPHKVWERTIASHGAVLLLGKSLLHVVLAYCLCGETSVPI